MATTVLTSPSNSHMSFAQAVERIFDPPIVMGLTLMAVTFAAVGFTAESVTYVGAGVISAAIIPYLLFHRAATSSSTPENPALPIYGQHLVPLAQTLLSLAVGCYVLVVMSAPVILVGALFTMLLSLTALTLINTRWPISIHNGVATTCLVLLIATVSPLLLVLLPIQFLISWARKQLGTHDILQLIAGSAVGGAVAILAIGVIGLL